MVPAAAPYLSRFIAEEKAGRYGGDGIRSDEAFAVHRREAGFPARVRRQSKEWILRFGAQGETEIAGKGTLVERNGLPERPVTARRTTVRIHVHMQLERACCFLLGPNLQTNRHSCERGRRADAMDSTHLAEWAVLQP